MRRRDVLAGLGLLALPVPPLAAAEHARVVPGRPIRFPEDEGAHPEFRTEWWYVTGWLNEPSRPLGFQVTFFRTRPHAETGNPSRFAARDIVIAHAAISEPAHGRLRHVQRAARAGFGLVHALSGRMDVKLDDWHLRADAEGYVTRIADAELGIDLRFERTQPPLLQGEAGYSRKGPPPESASYYYSHPHLSAVGKLRIGARETNAAGRAWLDHEWSSEYMAPEAVGWDWIGLNFDDGAALMAFRMRTREGDQHWAGATLRTAAGARRTFAPEEIRWTPTRQWRSPRTGADYPVAMRVRVGETLYDIEPLFDDQESDTRRTTGAVYWEGAVRARSAAGATARGYLELTGYTGRLRL